MRLLKRIILLTLLAGFACVLSCDEPKKKQGDAPAGHPDELRDSTRFDAAPDSELNEQTGPH